jgi:hypothetical protein
MFAPSCLSLAPQRNKADWVIAVSSSIFVDVSLSLHVKLGLPRLTIVVSGAGVELTTTQFYSAGYTDDFRRALLYLSIRYPRAKLLGIGFSLGANVMTRYLGEEGVNSKLASGCALACVRALRSVSQQSTDGKYNSHGTW